MADLSPSAQAVFDAAFKAYWNWDEDVPADSHTIAAAALRAAALHCKRDTLILLAIADELETL